MKNKMIKRLENSRKSLIKSSNKLIKAKAFRIWVENNPKVNILTYPYYRIKERKIIRELQEEMKSQKVTYVNSKEDK